MIRYAHVSGKPIRYLHIPSDRPASLFIPGNLQEIERVQYFSEGLAKRFNLFVLEPPGTGMTAALHAGVPFKTIADYVHEFVARYVGEKHHLCVFSYATPIGIEYVRRYPENILSVTLGGSMAEIPPEHRDSTMAILADVIRDKREFARRFIDLLTVSSANIPRHSAICRAALQRVGRYTNQQINCFKENTIRILAYHFEPLRITVPVVCFTGANDPYVTTHRCRKLADQLGAEFAAIPYADHLMHIEQPEATLQAMFKAPELARMVSCQQAQKRQTPKKTENPALAVATKNER